MKANAICAATAEYRSCCGCAVVVRVKRDEPAPACPKCGKATDWTFVRSDYLRPPKPPAPEEPV